MAGGKPLTKYNSDNLLQYSYTTVHHFGLDFREEDIPLPYENDRDDWFVYLDCNEDDLWDNERPEFTECEVRYDGMQICPVDEQPHCLPSCRGQVDSVIWGA